MESIRARITLHSIKHKIHCSVTEPIKGLEFANPKEENFQKNQNQNQKKREQDFSSGKSQNIIGRYNIFSKVSLVFIHSFSFSISIIMSYFYFHIQCFWD